MDNPAMSADGPETQAIRRRRMRAPLSRVGSAALFAVAAVLAAFNAVVPGFEGTDRVGLAAVTLACVAVAAFIARTRDPMSPLEMHAAATVGTLVVSTAIGFTGGAPNAGTMLYLWVALYSGYFFSRRGVAGHVVLMGAAYAVVIVLRPLPYSAVGNWATTVAGVAVAAGCVRLLKERLDWSMARVSRLAASDELTGLANRRGWAARADAETRRAARTGEPLGVALIDLDRFKAYNDEHGHAAGDRLLVACARAWGAALRGSDFLARLGGDEFAVLLPDCDETRLGEVAGRLHAAMPAGAGCSIGASIWRRDEAMESALRRADRAMYAEKGRTRGSEPPERYGSGTYGRGTPEPTAVSRR